MRCPYCTHDETQVVETRESDEGGVIRRRRRCQACEKRFTTYERIEAVLPVIVKKDGSREAYDRAKIRKGLLLALHKRPVPTSRIDEMLQEIEDELTARGELEIPSRAIGDLVMEKLKKEDQVAYVRFASVYRNFKDVSEFVQEVQPMLSERGSEKDKERERTGPKPAGG